MYELKCFIAMALGHEDIDKVYDDLVVPTLKDRKVRPIRIDRIEHNDDIDDRIIAELQECDFVIADLTYARPSVYFEAGYAQREVPVIYISRKDHFTPKADDEFGNYRVHFDLQMKNIIPWSSPTDRNFLRRLNVRIQKVISPIVRKMKAEQHSNLERAKFSALPIDDKYKVISDIGWSEISKNGYQEIIAEKPSRDPRYYFNTFPINLEKEIDKYRYENSQYKFVALTKPIRLGMKYSGTEVHTAIIYINDSTRKSYLDNLYSMFKLPPFYNVSPSKTGRISRLNEHIFIFSLKSVPQTRVMESLTSFSYDSEQNRYTGKVISNIPNKGIPNVNEIYVLPFGRVLARKTGNPFTTYYMDKGKIGTSYFYRKGEKPISFTRPVNRYINIYIISPIKSESNLLEKIKRTVELNK